MKTLDVSAYFAASSGLPFKDRWAVMPLQANLPLAPEEIGQQWQNIQNSALVGRKRLIYIHIPFCDIHCQFCGFYQNPLRKFDTNTYVDYLMQEIAMEINSIAMQSAPIHAIYFGGGTPTALAAGQLARIISYLKQFAPLMFGLPNQTFETWQQDLEIAESLPLDGVDLYSLNLLPTTPLAKGVENKRIELPTVADKYHFYQQGAEFLAKKGWIHLTNAHWAKTTRERNLYNFLIKQGSHFFAFGSCAGGKLGGQSFMVHRSLEQYYALLDQGKKPLMMLTGKTLLGDWLHQLQAGIEKGRIDLTQLTEHIHLFDPLIEQWHKVGLLQDTDHCMRLTLSGRFWSSNILQALQQLLLKLNNPEHIELQEKMQLARKAMQTKHGQGMPPTHLKTQAIKVNSSQ